MLAFLLTASVIGVTVQQAAKKSYNTKVPNGTFTFTAASILFALLVFVVTPGGKFNFSAEVIPYCILFAGAYSAASVGSFLAIITGPISITSLIIQYSLIIPTFYGIFFLDETVSSFFYVGIGLLLVSLLLVNLKSKKDDKKMTLKWGVFALLAFIGNGACSTVQKVQQMEMDGALKSEFMIISLLISFVVIGGAAIILERNGIGKKIKTGAHWYIICGLANGLVNLFVLMLAKYPASIVFPVISAGGIVATAIVGIFFYKEKLSVMQMIGMVLGTVSIVFLNL